MALAVIAQFFVTVNPSSYALYITPSVLYSTLCASLLTISIFTSFTFFAHPYGYGSAFIDTYGFPAFCIISIILYAVFDVFPSGVV